MPRHHREPEQPLDASNIRDILLVCSNRRLKAYLLTLASGGTRAIEALAIRLKDIDFSSSPTKIHLRKEFSKTRTARDIFISQEATAYLKEWLTWKYRDKSLDRSNPDRNKLKTYTKNPNDLVFTAYHTVKANNLYHEISTEFSKLLSSERVRLDERKEEGRQKRRKITLHSFRRYVKTTISNSGHQDFSEYILGHVTSSYYTVKEAKKKEIYLSLMPHLTFLDYNELSRKAESVDEQLKYKDDQINILNRQVASLKNSFETYVNDLPHIVDKLIEGRENVKLNMPHEVILSLENKSEETRSEIVNDWLLQQSQTNQKKDGIFHSKVE